MAKRKRGAGYGPYASGYGYKKARVSPAPKAPPRSKFRLGINSNKSIFPKKLRQTLVYCENFSMTTPALSSQPALAIYRMNGLYDPRYATGGHKPYGMDQLMAIYKRYTCLGAKMTVTFMCSDGSEYYDAIGGINITNVAAGPSSVDQAVESQYSTYTNFTQNSSPGRCRIGLDVAKYFSVTDVLDEAHLTGTLTSDPVTPVYAVVWATSSHPSKALTVTVKIEYDTVFTECNEVASS